MRFGLFFILLSFAVPSFTSCSSCTSDEDGNDTKGTTAVNVPEQHPTHISEEERIDSLLQVKIAHDTTTMYELPRLSKTCPEEVFYRVSYTVSYNSSTRNANWVAWSLSRNHTDGPFTRKKVNSSYYEDLDSMINNQLLSDWQFASPPYDHGHMCPAGDNKWDEAANRQTFFLSNICPQHEVLNQGDWENLESRSRGWAENFGEIFIVAGPIFDGSINYLPESKIAIPNKFYKVIMCLNPKPMAIGFVYPNDDTKHRLFEVAKSVDEIEKITGIDFFYLIDDETENQIEASYDLKFWNIRDK